MEYQFTELQISEAVKNNTSMAGTLRTLGIRAAGGNYKTLHSKISFYNINNSHWQGEDNFIEGTGVQNLKKIPLEQILIQNSNYQRTALKGRLFKENLLENKCYKCGQLPFWDDLPLVLQLDHINGIHNDNRIENLRILCPNCHTQSDTFGAKRFKLPDKICECGKKINKNSTRCLQCNNARDWNRKTKIEWPPLNEMIEFLKTNSFLTYAKKLGIVDTAIFKHLRLNNINPKEITKSKRIKEKRYCSICNKELSKATKKDLCASCNSRKNCELMRERKKLKISALN